MGGDDGRGGLLAFTILHEVGGEETIWNALNFILYMGRSYDDKGMTCLNVIKELRLSNLILKKDIRDHHLLVKSCHTKTEVVFDYLADWDPVALKETTHSNGTSFSTIHDIIIDHY